MYPSLLWCRAKLNSIAQNWQHIVIVSVYFVPLYKWIFNHPFQNPRLMSCKIAFKRCIKNPFAILYSPALKSVKIAVFRVTLCYSSKMGYYHLKNYLSDWINESVDKYIRLEISRKKQQDRPSFIEFIIKNEWRCLFKTMFFLPSTSSAHVLLR